MLPHTNLWKLIERELTPLMRKLKHRTEGCTHVTLCRPEEIARGIQSQACNGMVSRTVEETVQSRLSPATPDFGESLKTMPQSQVFPPRYVVP